MTRDARADITAAMGRLLEGNPLRSDGKLTIKSLAVEADVPRYLLTEVHTDLKDAFYARVKNMSRPRVDVDALVARLAVAEEQARDWRERALEAEADFEDLVRATQLHILARGHEAQASEERVLYRVPLKD